MGGFKTTGEEGDGRRQASLRSPSGEVEGWVHVEQVAAVLMLYIQCQTLRDCLVGCGRVRERERKEREWERKRERGREALEAVMLQGKEAPELMW